MGRLVKFLGVIALTVCCNATFAASLVTFHVVNTSPYDLKLTIYKFFAGHVTYYPQIIAASGGNGMIMVETDDNSHVSGNIGFTSVDPQTHQILGPGILHIEVPLVSSSVNFSFDKGASNVTTNLAPANWDGQDNTIVDVEIQK